MLFIFEFIVVANRLSEQYKVLLLEAGGEVRMNTQSGKFY